MTRGESERVRSTMEGRPVEGVKAETGGLLGTQLSQSSSSSSLICGASAAPAGMGAAVQLA